MENLVTLATVKIQKDASMVAVGLSHVAIAGVKNDQSCKFFSLFFFFFFSFGEFFFM